MPTAAKSKAGFALVEVLIAAAMMIALFFGSTYLLQSQTGSVRRMKVRLELLSLQLDIQAALSSRESCQQNFTFVIDEGRLADPTYGFDLNQLVEAGPPPTVLLTSHQPLTRLSSTAQVGQIRARNITKLGPDSFTMNVTAPVTGSNGAFFHNMSFMRVFLATDPGSPANAKVPVGCSYGSVNQVVGQCQIREAYGMMVMDATVLCAADEVLVSGGGRCVTSAHVDWEDPATPAVGDGGYIHHSRPVPPGWNFDCFNPNLDNVHAQAVAYCCKR